MAPAVDEFSVETDSEDDALYRPVPQPQSPAQESDTVDAVPRETLMDKEHPEVVVYPTAGMTTDDDPGVAEFPDQVIALQRP